LGFTNNPQGSASSNRFAVLALVRWRKTEAQQIAKQAKKPGAKSQEPEAL
jgi:hypothetical protein